MIARVYAPQVALWTPDSEAAVRQCGQIAAYGADHDFLCFYEDDHGNCLSVLDGAATLDVHGDVEEMCLFLSMDPSITSVRTDADTAKLLAERWTVSYETEAVMEAPLDAQRQDIAVTMPLKDVYPVLCEGFGKTVPPFDSWYADVHHRQRHGLCRSVGVYEDGVAVACAMTVAECEQAALIGAVATREAARGKGYASACVLTLAQRLHGEQKRVWLSPKTPYAHRLYDRLGFRVVGQWGSVKKSTQQEV